MNKIKDNYDADVQNVLEALELLTNVEKIAVLESVKWGIMFEAQE
jgi:hypothetical protein